MLRSFLGSKVVYLLNAFLVVVSQKLVSYLSIQLRGETNSGGHTSSFRQL